MCAVTCGKPLKDVAYDFGFVLDNLKVLNAVIISNNVIAVHFLTPEYADELEAELVRRGVDVIVDDREERPGVKFKDADLIGFPVRVVVGAKGLAGGGVEVKRRDEDKSKTRIVPVADAAAEIVRSL